MTDHCACLCDIDNLQKEREKRRKKKGTLVTVASWYTVPQPKRREALINFSYGIAHTCIFWSMRVKLQSYAIYCKGACPG